MNKDEIIAILEEIGIFLEIKGESPFKTRAYHAGARALESLEQDLGGIIEAGELQKIPGIGSALADKISTLYMEGTLPYYEDLKGSIPPGLIEMLEIPGLGPKKVKAIYEKLNIVTIEKLKRACEAGDVQKLPGFGKKSEEKIISGIAHRIEYSKRHLWWKANVIAQGILKGLEKLKSVEKAEAAGSFRRRLETVGDLDFLVAAEDSKEVMDWFTSMPGVAEVTAHGETKSSVRFEGGMQADLRVVPLDQFYFALHHFTGSKDHNVKMRQRALSMGISLSEWGLKNEAGEIIKKKIESEKALFKTFDLPYIPPELREGMDEFDSEIPDLIEEKDIKGVFHNHTTASDGRNSLEEMAAEAEALGWEYLGIADHSKSSYQANGLSEERLMKQVEVIKAFNESKKCKTHIFTGVECDILSDGELDFDASVLKELDYVVASVHTGFTQSEDAMTKRLIKAIESPHVTMLGHMTGRLLLRREPYALNIPKVIDAAIANNVIIELNSTPQRLDMDWRHWKKARDKGAICSINPDAHSTEGLSYYKAGINIARKGWLRKEDVFNTRSLKEVREYFAS